MELYTELVQRGYIERLTSEDLIVKLNQGKLTFYAGFDPTANSLHVGSLSLLNFMRILQKKGHRPIGLMGGATSCIGDPSGKNVERNLLSREELEKNIRGIQKQLRQFLNFSSENQAKIVNNIDWLGNFSYLDFLRDIGKHFSINMMISRDSVKSRLEREGISYTEFSYLLLQAYDFYQLQLKEGCALQVGGSDQWGNIVSGIDLTRRISQKQTYGLTIPLVTKSDGSKFGKSESGTIWLDPDKTSPFEFYQFFVRQADGDVIHLMKILTEIPLNEIRELEKSLVQEPHLRKSQLRLAYELTNTVHGLEQTELVKQASKVLYGEKIEDLNDFLIEQIFKDVPSYSKPLVLLNQGWSLVDALVESQAQKSKGNARKLIQSGGVYLNNTKITDHEMQLETSHLASEKYMILRTGKKNYRLIQFT